MENEIKRINDIIDTIRPFLVSDGGNIEFIKYEDNIVYIKMLGACSHCHMIDITLKDGIENALKEEIPSIVKVVNIKD